MDPALSQAFAEGAPFGWTVKDGSFVPRTAEEMIGSSSADSQSGSTTAGSSVNATIEKLGGDNIPTLSSDVSSGPSGEPVKGVPITSGGVLPGKDGIPFAFSNQAQPTNPTDVNRLIYSPYDQWLADYTPLPVPKVDAAAEPAPQVTPELSAEIERLRLQSKGTDDFLSRAPGVLAGLPSGRESSTTPISTMPKDVQTLPIGRPPITMEQAEKLLNDNLSIVQGPRNQTRPPNAAGDPGNALPDNTDLLFYGGLAAGALKTAGPAVLNTPIGQAASRAVTVGVDKGRAVAQAVTGTAKKAAVKAVEITWIGLGLTNASGIEKLFPLVTKIPIVQPTPIVFKPGPMAPVTIGNLGNLGSRTAGPFPSGSKPASINGRPPIPVPKLPKTPKPPSAIKKETSAKQQEQRDLIDLLKEKKPEFPAAPKPWGGATPPPLPTPDVPKVKQVPWPLGIEKPFQWIRDRVEQDKLRNFDGDVPPRSNVG